MIEEITFERIVKVDEDRRIAWGVVVEPGDSEEEFEEVERTAHEFVARNWQVRGAAVVESYLAPVNFTLGDQAIKKGSWIMGVEIHDPEEWEDLVGEGDGGEEEEADNIIAKVGSGIQKEIIETYLHKKEVMNMANELSGGKTAMQWIKDEAEKLRDRDPSLTESDALLRVLGTEQGKKAYQLYVGELRRASTLSADNRDSLAKEDTEGPATRELFEKADRLVEKSDGKLDRMAAVVKILKADSRLYTRYVKEIEVSTAVT